MLHRLRDMCSYLFPIGSSTGSIFWTPLGIRDLVHLDLVHGKSDRAPVCHESTAAELSAEQQRAARREKSSPCSAL